MRDKEVREREGGREGWREMKRGFEDSNQTCCDINTVQSGNLVRKIRYDYRECEQRDCSSQSNQRLFEAISRWINIMKFLTLARDDADSVFIQRGKKGVGIHLNVRHVFFFLETWGRVGVCKVCVCVQGLWGFTDFKVAQVHWIYQVNLIEALNTES